MACSTSSQRTQLDIKSLLSALETSQKNPVVVPVLRLSRSGVLLWLSYGISVVILCFCDLFVFTCAPLAPSSSIKADDILRVSAPTLL